MKKLSVFCLAASLFLVACGPTDPNASVKDLCLIQITDANERMQEFVSEVSTIDFSSGNAVDKDGFQMTSIPGYISVSFYEHNASEVSLNIGHKYKISIIPIYTHGELVEIQNR